MATVPEAALRQYRAVKAEMPDTIFLFHLGDCYEMFEEDAQVASTVLGIPLATDRAGVAMAGVPCDERDVAVKRLIEADHKVAICEPKGED